MVAPSAPRSSPDPGPGDHAPLDGTADGRENPAPPRDTDAMPRWVPRAIALALAGVLLLGILNWLFFRVRELLIMLLVSLFLSFALEPAVNRLAARGMRRGAATALVFVGLLLSVGVFLGALGTLVVQEVSDFVEEAPEYVADLEEQVNDTFGTELNSDELVDSLTEADGPVQEFATKYAGNAVSIGATALGVLFQLLTISLFTFYLVADGPGFRRAICSFLPPMHQHTVLRNWELAIDKTGGYIYSRALLAGLSAVATFAFLEVLGVPYALALAVWVGLVSQFVPVVGTYLAGAFPVVIAAIDEPVDGLWVLGFIVVYQQIENYLFAPRITARTMELHPAVAFGTVIAGAGILGPVGAVLALPVAAMIQAVGSTYLNRHEVVETDMTRDRRDASRPGIAARWRNRVRSSSSASDD
jgi:predicted PurR-regulated permease PerM